MESSARWADRGGPSFQLGGGVSKKDSFPRLEGLIRYACESMNVSPHQRYAQENMDAHAAVCDEILSKGIETNAACHAVYMIVQKYINGSVLDSARRGLQLLDSCVKNCGDPCHLAVSEKDFLNELVRRFGPTPPPRNVIQQDILRLIETWNRTIAQKSFIKDDLGYIRDMHRLLVNKGFVFPDPDPDDVNALNGLEVKGLQTEDALKERRNLALKAKLQAYLRRGGNRNLQEANKIIKVLSDYDQSDKAEIRQEAADRIQDVRERTRLLTERLNTLKPGEKIESGDAFESLVNDLKSEQHKLHNTLQNDRESDDSMTVLLTVNEEINRVIEWYDALKAGNATEAQRLAAGGATKGGVTTASASRSAGGDLSLIDFDDPQPIATAINEQQNLQDDLLGLSLSDSTNIPNISNDLPRQSTPQIPPGFPQPQQTSLPTTGVASSTTDQQSRNLKTPVAPAPPSKPNYDLLSGSFGSPTTTGNVSTASPASLISLQQHASQGSITKVSERTLPQVDPFASIASSARASPRPGQTSTMQSVQNSSSRQSPGNSQSLLEAARSKPVALNSAHDAFLGEDDWDFSGAPPPEEEDFAVFNEDIKIEFQVSRASETSLVVTAVFSNNTANPISKLEFLTGMPKMYPRKIDPISSSRLQPHQAHGAYQRFTIEGVPRGQAKQVPRIKWRVSRTIRDDSKLDQGEAQSLSID